jgi:hypothetical protein
MGFDEREHLVMGLLISRDDQPSICVERVPVKVANDAASGIAERDARREVHVVSELSVRDVRRSTSGRDPRDAQGGRDHSWAIHHA